MNVTHLSFLVVMLAKCVITGAEFSPVEWSVCVITGVEFSPVEWSVSSFEQCGQHSRPDLTGVLTTVTQMILNNKSPSSLPKSCMEIKESSPDSPPGYYTINSGTSGSAGVVYCNMDDFYSCAALEQIFFSGIEKDLELLTHIGSPSLSSCLDLNASDPNNVICTLENSTYCNITGPWVELASWDVSQSGSSCPSELQLFVNGSVSACGKKKESSGGCQSLPLFSSPVPYTQVCGKMRGYQKGSTDAFVGSNINKVYVDGVSITRGSPRQHVWTYVIGQQENIPKNVHQSQCPCTINDTSISSPPAFVGSDYFCESGCPAYKDLTTFHSADPLWDGQGCGTLEAGCCTPPGQPWFHKVLDGSTTDYIEIRLCTDQGVNDENVLISSFEIYAL